MERRVRLFAGFMLVVLVGAGCARDEVVDFDAIRERGTLRIIAPRLSGREQRLPRSGYPLDFGRELAATFSRDHGLEPEFVWVNSRDELIPALLRGRGDLIAASLTVTPERAEQIAFSVRTDVVREQVVTRVSDTVLTGPEMLEGRTLALRRSSSYWETAVELQRTYPGLSLRPVSERTDTEEILYDVAMGRYDITIADNNIVDQALSYLPGLRTAFDVTDEREVAWGLRPDATQLKAAVDSFLETTTLRPIRASRSVGDLDAIRERGVLRVLTSNSAATYFIWRGELLGFEYELARRFAGRLGVRLEVLVPPSRASLLTWLRQGYGDIVAAGLTPNAEREAGGIAFSVPYHRVVETVVVRADETRVRRLSDLAGRTIAVRRTSSYWNTAQRLLDAGAEFDLVATAPAEETEEIIDRVGSGDYDMTIADSHILDIELTWRDDVRGAFALGDSVGHAWAVREEDTRLLRAIDDFLTDEIRGRWYNIVHEKYFGRAELISERVGERGDLNGVISPYDELFRRYGAQYDLDWRLLAAQAYEESRFNPDAVSFAGAMGLMQVMPETARAFGYDDPYDPEEAVDVGAMYLRHQVDMIEDAATEEDRMWFALASYNAGYGHVSDARRLATELGRDPNLWFGGVEAVMPLLARAEYHSRTRYGYCRCLEPVNYVRRVREKYRAYRQLVPDL